jgi:hypothetical protein
MLDDVVTVPDPHSLTTFFLFLCACGCACRFRRVHEPNIVSEEDANEMEVARQRQKVSEEVSSTLRSRPVVNSKLRCKFTVASCEKHAYCITNKLNYNNAATMSSRINPL